MASGLREKIFASKLYRLTLAGKTPPIAAVVAPEPWLGRPEIGTEIAQREFRLVGRTFPLGPRPWAVSLPGRRAQADDEQRRAVATHEIVNDGSEDELIAAVAALWSELSARAPA